MKQWRRRRERAPEAEDGQQELVPEDESVNPFGAEHAWWAERQNIQRVFVSPPKSGGEAQERQQSEFWRPESLFTYGPRPGAEVEEKHRDPYDVLGVPLYATWDEITTTYRRLAKQHHPDRYVDATEQEQADSEARMREINSAYHELVSQRRAATG